MATRYVRTTGNDANAGTSAGAAWLTLGKLLGAAGIQSGETAYIGAGTYREVVTVAMTSAVAETSIIGDVDGAQTGDAGPVRWTAYTTNDTSAPSGSPLLTLAARDHLTFQNLILQGGTNGTAAVISSGSQTSTDITIRDCALINGTYNQSLAQVNVAQGVAANWLIERCTLLGGGTCAFRITLDTSTLGSDYDANMTFQNCLFLDAGRGLLVEGSAANVNKGGGVNLLSSTVLGAFGNGAVQALGTGVSTTFPCTAYNNVVRAGIGFQANTVGQVLEDFNLIWSPTARSNVTAGGSSQTSPNYGWLFEMGQARNQGFLPQTFLTPMVGSPALGFGNHSGAPTVDFLNRTRPAGGSSTSSAIGYLERHDAGAREASVIDASTYALKLTGPGDHDLLIPVNAAATTITVRGRYDTNHATTNKPQVILQANGEIGVATQTVTMTVGVDTWETLTIGPFTPSAKGFVTLRLLSRSAAGNGIAYFDTITSTVAIGTGSEDYWRRGEAFPAATTSAAASAWNFP